VAALLDSLFARQDSAAVIATLLIGRSVHQKLELLQRLVVGLGWESLTVFGDCFDEVRPRFARNHVLWSTCVHARGCLACVLIARACFFVGHFGEVCCVTSYHPLSPPPKLPGHAAGPRPFPRSDQDFCARDMPQRSAVLRKDALLLP
jgi:hypothetical protein